MTLEDFYADVVAAGGRVFRFPRGVILNRDGMGSDMAGIDDSTDWVAVAASEAFSFVDVDLYKPGGPEALAWLQSVGIEDAYRVKVRTAKGGLHYWLPRFDLGEKNGSIMPAMDVKSWNPAVEREDMQQAFLFAPGTVRNGGGYELLDVRLDEDVTEAASEVARELAARWEAARARVRPAEADPFSASAEYRFAMDGPEVTDGRHEFLRDFVWHLAGRGLDRLMQLELARAMAARRVPSLSDDDYLIRCTVEPKNGPLTHTQPESESVRESLRKPLTCSGLTDSGDSGSWNERARGQLMDDVSEFVGRFLALPSQAAHIAVALWAVHAHFVSDFESTPRLAVLSPEPGSGKTRVLEIVELLVPRPLHTTNISTAALFRIIEQDNPTVLFDEADAVFGPHGKGMDNEDLRSLLNSGHRKGGVVYRCIEHGDAVKAFRVYGPAALAGLGDLPDTLMSRSIVIRMRRRLRSQRVESFRARQHGPEGDALRLRLAEMAESFSLAESRPAMPGGVEDRPADVWEPILAVADAMGGRWPVVAREACVELIALAADRPVSLSVQLLMDMREVMSDWPTGEPMSSTVLISRLRAMDDGPWTERWAGKPQPERDLAFLVKPYGIKPRQFGSSREGRYRGYVPTDCHDAWERYLPPARSFD